MKLRKLAQRSSDEEEEEEEEEMLKELEEAESLLLEEVEVKEEEDPKPAGNWVMFSGEGNEKRSHYSAFEFAGNHYTIEDPVLLTPETKEQKPDIAIIKDIAQTIDGTLMVTGQMLYRPEEAKTKIGGCWPIGDPRELFYSTHRVEVLANCIMHKCVLHFVPITNQLPDCGKHPGFIVQQVYDAVQHKVWKMADKDLNLDL